MRLIRLGSVSSTLTTTTHPSSPSTTTTRYLANCPEPGKALGCTQCFLAQCSTESNPEKDGHTPAGHQTAPRNIPERRGPSKHSYTSKTSSTAELEDFVVKNVCDCKIILKISYRHFISGHLNHSEVSSAHSSKAQHQKCFSAVLVVN